MRHRLDKNIDSNSYKELINTGKDLAVALVGAAVSSRIGGDIGTYVAAVTAVMLDNLALDFSRRVLATREKKRVGAVLILARQKVESNFVAGKNVRQDDFFTNQSDGRSSAEEIAEGVLIASQREYEERKLPFYGNLLGNLAFTSSYDRAYSNLLIKIAKDLSYRQLCLLYIVHNNKNLNLQHRSLRQRDKDGEEDVSREKLGVLQELVDLHRRGVIVDASNTAWIDVSDATVDRSLVELGTALYDLMELSKIRAVDVQETAVLFI